MAVHRYEWSITSEKMDWSTYKCSRQERGVNFHSSVIVWPRLCATRAIHISPDWNTEVCLKEHFRRWKWLRGDLRVALEPHNWAKKNVLGVFSKYLDMILKCISDLKQSTNKPKLTDKTKKTKKIKNIPWCCLDVVRPTKIFPRPGKDSFQAKTCRWDLMIHQK